MGDDQTYSPKEKGLFLREENWNAFTGFLNMNDDDSSTVTQLCYVCGDTKELLIAVHALIIKWKTAISNLFRNTKFVSLIGIRGH